MRNSKTPSAKGTKPARTKGKPPRRARAFARMPGPESSPGQARLELAAIVESSEDAILSKDLNGMIHSWNKGAEHIFGYPAAAMIGRHVSFLLPRDYPDDTIGIMERLRRGERIEHYETRRRTKDGRILSVSLTISPIRDESGAVVGASTIARDISERKRSEDELRRSRKALQESELRFRSLVQNSSDIITILNSDGSIRYESPSIERILGYKPEDLVGKSAFDFVHPDDRPHVVKVFEQHLAISGSITPLELRFRHNDGSWR